MGWLKKDSHSIFQPEFSHPFPHLNPIHVFDGVVHPVYPWVATNAMAVLKENSPSMKTRRRVFQLRRDNLLRARFGLRGKLSFPNLEVQVWKPAHQSRQPSCHILGEIKVTHFKIAVEELPVPLRGQVDTDVIPIAITHEW